MQEVKREGRCLITAADPASFGVASLASEAIGAGAGTRSHRLGHENTDPGAGDDSARATAASAAPNGVQTVCVALQAAATGGVQVVVDVRPDGPPRTAAGGWRHAAAASSGPPPTDEPMDTSPAGTGTSAEATGQPQQEAPSHTPAPPATDWASRISALTRDWEAYAAVEAPVVVPYSAKLDAALAWHRRMEAFRCALLSASHLRSCRS
jgi:hypothetical protein